MSSCIGCSCFLVVTYRAFMLICSCFDAGRSFDFIPITVRVTICRNLGYVCLIIATRAMVRFATNFCTCGSDIYCPFNRIIVSESIDGLCLTVNLCRAYGAVDYAIIASVGCTIRLNTILNNCIHIRMSKFIDGLCLTVEFCRT